MTKMCLKCFDPAAGSVTALDFAGALVRRGPGRRPAPPSATSTSAWADRAAAFYHGALGLDKVVWGYPGALFLSAGGYHHHLGLNTWAAGAPPAGDDDTRLLEWTLVVPTVDDVEATARSLEAAGYAPTRDVPRHRPLGHPAPYFGVPTPGRIGH